MLRRYFMRFAKWGRYASGRSYQHVDQGVGRAFVPGQLAGYFNDLTGKADWKGRTGPHGVPVVRTDTAESFAFPIVIFQWGLGNWDRALLTGEDARKQYLMAAARWAVETLDEKGGWSCWHELRRPTISFYSAMAQGEGLSVLARAHSLDPDGPWLEAGSRAFHFLMNSGAEGLTRDLDGLTVLEEYPGDVMPSVLNGWMFALVGVADHALATGDPTVAATADRLAADLAKALPRFDTGYWSTYDLGGNLTSPFYHDLHSAQLAALAMLFPKHRSEFDATRLKFEAYAGNRFKRMRAIAVKIRQKLGQADVGEMTEA